jgi:iron complex transport system ATP-binding protein
MPFTAHDDQVAEKAMRLVGLENFRDRLVTELSGGELQRVVLARVLAQEPAVLLLDEPTAHLDLKFQTELFVLVRHLAHQNGMTVVVSLHDLNLAAVYADRLALLGNGQLVSVGTPEEVMTAERLTQVYGVPIMVLRHPLWGTPLIVPNAQEDKFADHG